MSTNYQVVVTAARAAYNTASSTAWKLSAWSSPHRTQQAGRNRPDS